MKTLIPLSEIDACQLSGGGKNPPITTATPAAYDLFYIAGFVVGAVIGGVVTLFSPVQQVPMPSWSEVSGASA